MKDNTKAKNLVGEINDLLKIDYEKLQGWSQLRKWPLYESRMINGSINTKVIDSLNHIRFISQIPGEFIQHWHDCAEVCTVLAGELTDKDSGQIWTVGEQAVFSRGQKHTPMNSSKTGNCFIIVDFYR